MKNQLNIFKKSINAILCLSIIVFAVSCEDAFKFDLPEAGSLPDNSLPTAHFEYIPNAENFKKLEFNNLSTESIKYLWDFGGGVTSTDKDPTHIFEGGEGTYPVTLTAIDDAGNTMTCTVNVIIVDDTNPTITCGAAPAAITANASCMAVIPDLTGNATAADNCDTDVDIVMEENTEQTDCETIITRTYTATDNCGNVSTATQTVTAIDEDAKQPDLGVTHLDKPLGELKLKETGEPSQWSLRIPIPVELIGDGAQTFLIFDKDTGETLDSFTIIAGDAVTDDIRAEVALLRAELDMVKRAFRRHCVETT